MLEGITVYSEKGKNVLKGITVYSKNDREFEFTTAGTILGATETRTVYWGITWVREFTEPGNRILKLHLVPGLTLEFPDVYQESGCLQWHHVNCHEIRGL